jgi:hypothetical protein
LGIVGSPIEITMIFLLASIVTNLRTYRLQTYNLERLIFVRKNWPNNLKVVLLDNLVELIEG